MSDPQPPSPSVGANEWNPLSDWDQFARLSNSQENDVSIPIELETSFTIISKSIDLLEKWIAFVIGSRRSIDVDVLTETETTLTRSGMRNEISTSFIFFMISAAMGRFLRGISEALIPEYSNRKTAILTAMLSGYQGPPSHELLIWLADHIGDDKSTRFSILLSSLRINSMRDDDTDSSTELEHDEFARNIVRSVLPYWKILPEYILDEFGPNIGDLLGFPLWEAEELRDNVEYLLWRARVYFVYGQPGDEEIACEYAAKAGFQGSREAWEMMREWSADPYYSRFLAVSLIDEGIENLCPE